MNYPSYHFNPVTGFAAGLSHYYVYYIFPGNMAEVVSTSIMASSAKQALEIVSYELGNNNTICADLVEL